MNLSGYIRVDQDFLPEQEAKYYEPLSEQTFCLSKLQLLAALFEINESFHKNFIIPLNEVLIFLGGKADPKFERYGWSMDDDFQNYCWSYFSPPWIRPYYYVNKSTGDLVMTFEVEPVPLEELYS